MGLPYDLIWLAVPLYVVLQAVALARPGDRTPAALLPLTVMVPLFAYAGVAFARESNLWPLPLLFASPVAVLYLAAVLLLTRRGAGPRTVGGAYN